MKTNMLLIIFWGLIAKLVSVSGDCDIGSSEVDDFDWDKYSGPRPWYVLLHSHNDIENDLSCTVVKYGSPEGNTSLITVEGYSNSKKRYVTYYATGKNWNYTGWEETYEPPTMWSKRFYVISIDYDRYGIFKHCSSDPNKTRVYVSYRSQHPDKETREEVMNKLKEFNIDVSELKEYKTDHCKQA